ncbi:MAG: hypothetical protein HOI95_23540 [Chromatiales bacterium]|nr:hypothetical protein [Chromatiales bacterium]
MNESYGFIVVGAGDLVASSRVLQNGRWPVDVVDEQLGVHGVDGLRVADASVLPFHVSSNPRVPSTTVGEKAANFMHGNQR